MSSILHNKTKGIMELRIQLTTTRDPMNSTSSHTLVFQPKSHIFDLPTYLIPPLWCKTYHVDRILIISAKFCHIVKFSNRFWVFQQAIYRALGTLNSSLNNECLTICYQDSVPHHHASLVLPKKISTELTST